MRSIFLSSAACCLLFSLQALPAAEDADAVYKQGVSKLRDAQSDHAALVPATKLLAHAAELYEAAGDEAKVADVNSCLYWAKKKMTLADTETLHGEPVTSKRLEAAAKPVAVSEAMAMLDNADAFAKSHTDDPFLVSIRFFEIADRFSDAPEGKKAMQQSLAAMQKVGEKSTLETYKPAHTDGKVFVKSEPVDAAIILITADGGKMDTGKKTPSLIQLPVGRQTLELTHKGYKSFALIVEVDGKAIAKPDAAKLEPLTVPVDITFEEGWTVFVDGKPAKAVGTGKAETPCTVELPLGGHELGLGKDGFLDLKQRVDVVEGGVKAGQGMPQAQVEIKAKPSKGISLLASIVSILIENSPGITIDFLAQGKNAHNNFSSEFQRIPAILIGKQFTQIVNGDIPDIDVIVEKSGKIYVMTFNGWIGTKKVLAILKILGATPFGTVKLSNAPGNFTTLDVWELMVEQRQKFTLPCSLIIADRIKKQIK